MVLESGSFGLLYCVTASIHTEKQENGSLSALLLFKSLVQSPVAMLRACPHAVFDRTMCWEYSDKVSIFIRSIGFVIGPFRITTRI